MLAESVESTRATQTAQDQEVLLLWKGSMKGYLLIGKVFEVVLHLFTVPDAPQKLTVR